VVTPTGGLLQALPLTGAAVTDVISCEQSTIIDQWTLAVKSTFAVDFSFVGAALAANNQPSLINLQWL
jgi:hypothetical protein